LFESLKGKDLTMDGFSVTSANRFLNAGLSSNNSIESGSFKLPKVSTAKESSGASFAETLNKAVMDVNQLQKQSDTAIQNFASGKTDNIADVMMTVSKADVATRMMMQVRNKIVDAYQEIMKMQV
jgi:flagellar hook-basal body complex protein FliE